MQAVFEVGRWRTCYRPAAHLHEDGKEKSFPRFIWGTKKDGAPCESLACGPPVVRDLGCGQSVPVRGPLNLALSKIKLPA